MSKQPTPMSSSRPYMVRALYDWILENDCTPYILVNALADNVMVPTEHIKNGQIVLNVSPNAIRDLELSNEAMMFNGRFGGVPMDIYAPMSAVLGIYARENGQGMIFEMEDLDPEPEPPKDKRFKTVESSKPAAKTERAERPSLKVVK
ncbi:ClpXP protease specificity-enhancing factor [Dasania marina]|uniref:ClpXP protease specificity-enhancing factor n=1 Tax=Dasania marina TaxID=471499 RepID=UPI0003816209|nr:ClpXP protease specificity-enhancing factor [Dasania marina]